MIPLSESLGDRSPDKAGACDIPLPTVCRYGQHSDQQPDTAVSDRAGAARGGPDAGLSDLLLQFLVWDHPPGKARFGGLRRLEVWEEGRGETEGLRVRGPRQGSSVLGMEGRPLTARSHPFPRATTAAQPTTSLPRTASAGAASMSPWSTPPSWYPCGRRGQNGWASTPLTPTIPGPSTTSSSSPTPVRLLVRTALLEHFFQASRPLHMLFPLLGVPFPTLQLIFLIPVCPSGRSLSWAHCPSRLDVLLAAPTMALSCIPSLGKYLWDTYQVPGTGETVVSKIRQSLTSWILQSSQSKDHANQCPITMTGRRAF